MELVIILLVAGAVMLMLETVLPGLIVGLCGLACWMVAVAVAFQRTDQGIWVLLFVLAGGGIGAVLWFKYFWKVLALWNSACYSAGPPVVCAG